VAAYKALGQENARLTAAAKGLERDLQRFTADGGALAAELHAARETVTRVEHENRQYVADLQAFERQADTLTREMHRCVSLCPSSLLCVCAGVAGQPVCAVCGMPSEAARGWSFLIVLIAIHQIITMAQRDHTTTAGRRQPRLHNTHTTSISIRITLPFDCF
jgi:hypothetical protein